jgi:hypothetical protein
MRHVGSNQSESNPFPFICWALGSLILVIGIGWIYPPAAAIAGGLLLLGMGFLGRSIGFGGGQ